jgi:hypothetical protein
MDLIQLLVVLIVFGFISWLIWAYVPMPQPVKSIVMGIIVLILVIYLLSAVGLLHMPVAHARELYLP